jgi:regulation of enolase protein 1 (concanavalin A-like superfamily)
VKLTRAGNVIAAFTSANGTTWSSLGQQTIPMATTVEIGLAVTSHNASTTAAATFDQVLVTRGATLPTGWHDGDIGSVGVAGSASMANGVFTIRGSGTDIWGPADGFHFAYRSLDGDGQMIARVASLQNTHRWAKAGVMIRGSNTASSVFGAMVVAPSAGSAFQYRQTSGGPAATAPGAGVAPPNWVKVTRAGSVLSGYQSADGVTWQFVGRATIPTGTAVSIGLAVSSHDNATLSKATFDKVQ